MSLFLLLFVVLFALMYRRGVGVGVARGLEPELWEGVSWKRRMAYDRYWLRPLAWVIGFLGIFPISLHFLLNPFAALIHALLVVWLSVKLAWWIGCRVGWERGVGARSRSIRGPAGMSNDFVAGWVELGPSGKFGRQRRLSAVEAARLAMVEADREVVRSAGAWPAAAARSAPAVVPDELGEGEMLQSAEYAAMFRDLYALCVESLRTDGVSAFGMAHAELAWQRVSAQLDSRPGLRAEVAWSSSYPPAPALTAAAVMPPAVAR